MTLTSWLKRRKQYSKKLSLSNILNYAEAEVQAFKAEAGTAEQYIVEQAIWRLSQVKEKSPGCMQAMGYCNVCDRKGLANQHCTYCFDGMYTEAVGVRCQICGCDTKDLTFGIKSCEGQCYPERMNKEEWNQFKLDNKITQIC